MKNSNKDMATRLRFVESLIKKHSTAARTRGNYKGHSSTNVEAWIGELASTMQTAIKQQRGKVILYDENMAIASNLGAVLTTWYCLVHRAKSYDENRPAALRRKALRAVHIYRTSLIAALNDDMLMGKVWDGQKFCPPIGKGVKSGKFV